MKKGSIFIFIGIILAACVFYGVRYFRTPLDTQVLEMTKREETFAGQAYIIRNESVYTAPTTGTVYHYAAEGARVSKNSLVSAVYDGQVNEETLQELNNVDKKIAQAEEDQRENALYVSDASRKESKLAKLRNQIVDASFDNDIAQISECKDKINWIQSGEAGNDAATLATLHQERMEIESRIGQTKQDVHSQMSGIFSTTIDGLETVLTPETILQYTVEDFENLPEVNVAGTQVSMANTGDNICKVADNHVWYVMMLVDKEDIANVVVGTDAEIRFDKIPGVQTAVEVVQITETPDAEQALLILKSERYSEGVFSIRQSDAEIVLKSYEGFLVPVHAIRVQDGEKGVMVQRGSGEIFKRCEVVYVDSDTETAIIKPVNEGLNILTMGDRVILGEKTDNPTPD